MLKRWLKRFAPYFFRFYLYQLKIRNKKKFLVLWNRGLGDIPLGLYGFHHRIYSMIPDAELTYVTRSDLEEGFFLLERPPYVIVDPLMERGKNPNRALMKKQNFDVVIEKLNLTDWLQDQIGKLVPRLRLSIQDLDLVQDRSQIFLHVQSETAQFYGYTKDWPIKKWRELIYSLNRVGIKPCLIGLKKDSLFEDLDVQDQRGDYSLNGLLKQIVSSCSILIAPDSGILSIIYYLDFRFPIRVISLWADPHQGVLRQKVRSPNDQLVHFPIIKNPLSHLEVEEVLKVLC